MKKVLAVAIVLAMVVGASAQTKHVFWYKVISKNYNIADVNGPDIQGTVVKHEGKALTAYIRGSAGDQAPTFVLGNGLLNAAAFSSVIWYADLCSSKLTAGATLTSAKFRGEYRDNWSGNAFCNAGPLNAKVGVVSIQGHLDALSATPATHSDVATWADPVNPLGNSMGFDMPGTQRMAQQTISKTAVAGNNGSTPLLEGEFFELDVTSQVNYILSNPGQLGIAASVASGDGNTGKVNLYGFEDCNISGATLDPWTKDGNTCHLVLEIANGTLENKVAAEKMSMKAVKTASVSVNPSPCNSVTTVSYNTGLAKNGAVKIFNIEGKLVHSEKVAGQGSFVWSAKNLTKGLYVCRIEAGKNVVSRNLIVM